MAVIGVASSDWFPADPSQSIPHDVWGGSGWARIGQYLPYLRSEHKVIVGTLVWDKDRFRINQDSVLHDVDVVLMHRLMHKGLEDTVLRARVGGQIVINDIDDWYWGLDPKNYAFLASHPKYNDKEDRYTYRSILSNSDLVIASTPYLLSRLDWVKAEMCVITNTVDLSRFTVIDNSDTTVPLVGWVGSTAHRSGDLEQMRGILGPLYASGNIRLMHGGHHPRYPLFAEVIGVPTTAVSTLPLSSHQDYPGLLKMDVGIVPLRVTPFNRSKSYIKGLEYAASGIPFVAQSIDSYDDLYAHGIGFTARKPADWIRHLKRLQDPGFRRDKSGLGLENVKKFDISNGARLFVSAINSVI